MVFERASGVLLHPTSFPGPYGIGDLGDEAFRFIDFLKESGQSLWQVLPLGPTGYGDSPYQCFSAFAGNPLLISPDRLLEVGVLSFEDLAEATVGNEGKIDYGTVIEHKKRILEIGFSKFNSGPHPLRPAYDDFQHKNSAWLEDYALFRALKSAQDGKSWDQWDDRVKRREQKSLQMAADHLRHSIDLEKFSQFLFFRQWSALKEYCHTSGIKVIGDIPIFVAYDSVDVWRSPQEFKLDHDGVPIVVAGVPPDYFSETGQLWGNPIYDWGRMQAEGFRWWIDRLKGSLEMYDILRIDHFRGFAATWEVPGNESTAVNGHWISVPGRALFVAIRNALGELPIIAEDLGVITPDVVSLRDEFGFPGMKILQFGFGGDPRNQDLPHNYVRNCVAYTGTHDNDTVVGWFTNEGIEGSTRDQAQIERERSFCKEYLNAGSEEINWVFIRALLSSVANTAVVPLQDLLGSGSDARMNMPSTSGGNWHWRFKAGALTTELASRLGRLTEIYGRTRIPESAAGSGNG